MTFVEGWRVAGVLVHVVPRRNIYAVAIVTGQGFSLRDNETWASGFKNVEQGSQCGEAQWCFSH